MKNFTADESDNAKSWPTSEPAIDFAATTPLAFAMQMGQA